MIRSQKISAIILKSKDYKESDRLVTLLSKENGRFTAIAKGVRKIQSKRKAQLEPGNLVRLLIYVQSQIPIITEIETVDDCFDMPKSLPRFRQLFLLLEMFYKLFVEEEIPLEVWQKVLFLKRLCTAKTLNVAQIRLELSNLIGMLGFQTPDLSHSQTISAYMEILTNAQLKSTKFLANP